MNPDIKVLNVLEEGRWGGPQKRVLLVARELKELGIQTIVVIPKRGTQIFQQKLEENQIPYYAIKFHRLTKNFRHLSAYGFSFFKEIMNLKEIIKKENIDIVHANGSYQFKAILAARLAKTKSVWHLNDTYVIKPIKLFFDYFLKYRTDGFFVAGERVKSYYLKRTPRNIIISYITPPVDMATYQPQTSNKKALPKEAINITLIANWSQIKGHSTFIKMAKLVSNDNPKLNCRFNIVGSEIENQMSYYNQMQKLIRDSGLDNIYVLGQRDDIRNILNDTDISVCSSNFEASPTTVWEAMAMANPIVSTDVGDVRNYCLIYNCGFVVDVGDFKSMAKEIDKLIKDSDLRQELGARARKAAIKNFGLHSIVDRHEKVYRKLTYAYG